MSRPAPHRSKSLYLSETSFFEAAIHATTSACTATTIDQDDKSKSIQVAKSFLQKTCPELLEVLLEQHQEDEESNSEDRLIKVGRNVTSTLNLFHHNNSSETEELAENKLKLEESLALLADECRDLANLLSTTTPNNKKKIPTVRFGKTELQIPIVTLGCMRFQQSWNRDDTGVVVDRMDLVEQKCQSNLVQILKHAIRNGVTHIETAKGYGSSELQLGEALQYLFQTNFVKRSELIVQTKGGVSSSMTVAEYKQQVLDQLALLKLDYVDLFSVHGINSEDHLKWLFDNDADKGNLFDALIDLKKEGKIRHIGFSTHGHGDLIERTISSNMFEYVNLHYHFCGSYTTTGDGEFGGNLSNVRLAHKLDMGVFCISPYDKGGRVYCPSNKLRSLTLPDMEPMAYGSTWLWQHATLDDEQAPIHTIVCGAARPSDLDQPIMAALKLHEKEISEKRARIQRRLKQAMEDAIGKDFSKTWHVGLPNWKDASRGTQLGNIVWMHNLIKGYGLLEYSKERYAPMETSLTKWDPSISSSENVVKNMPPYWGWQPGCAIDPDFDYSNDLSKCPPENQEMLLEAIKFVHKWCGKAPQEEVVSAATDTSEEQEDEKKEEEPVEIPFDWQDAYDMRPWTAFPER